VWRATKQVRASKHLVEQLVTSQESQCWFEERPELSRCLPQLLVHLRRLQQLQLQFETSLEQEKLASLKQFAYGASHEINNPLANISTRAQTLLRDESNVDRRRKLETINRQAFRASEMIADLMLFAKPPRLELNRVRLPRLLETVISELRREADEQQTALTLVPSAGPLILRADATQLSVAVRAICINALEALRRGGWVEVAARKAGIDRCGQGGDAIEVVIRDSGPGIVEEVRRHLFDPFYSSREAGRGLGFGLAKAWIIINNHQGQIEVESQPGRGSTFRILLPVQRLRVEG
jgi:signal transduction histidine kinase